MCELLRRECTLFSSRSSRLLLTVVYNLLKLLDKFGVLFLFPSIVGSFDALLHLLESLLEHRGEAGVHLFDELIQLFDFVILLLLDFLFLRLNVRLFLLQKLDFLFVGVNALHKLGIMLSEFFIS